MVERIEFEQAWKGMYQCRITFLECVLYFGSLIGVASLYIADTHHCCTANRAKSGIVSYIFYISLYGLPQQLSRYNDSYGLDGSGFEIQWGNILPYMSRLALCLTQPPVPWVPAVFSRDSGIDYPPPSNDEFKERVALCLYLPSESSGYQVNFTLYQNKLIPVYFNIISFYSK